MTQQITDTQIKIFDVAVGFKTKKPLAGCLTVLFKPDTNEIWRTVTNKNGYYEFILDRDGMTYGIYEIRFYGSNAIQKYNPSGDWITFEISDAGNYVDYLFCASASVPPSPSQVANPTGWFDAPPSSTDPIWMIKAFKNPEGNLVGSWSSPIQLTGSSLVVEFSSDQLNWHSTFVSGDIWMRQKIGLGDWSAAMRVVGETGKTGPSPVYRGPYKESGTKYYSTDNRVDIVKYNEKYWKCKLTTGDNAGSFVESNWFPFEEQFSNVATELLLAIDATIARTLIMGEDTDSKNCGTIRSARATDALIGDGFYISARPDSGGIFRMGTVSAGVLTSGFYWNGAELLVHGKIWSISGGIGGTATAPSIDITSNGLKMMDGSIARLYIAKNETNLIDDYSSRLIEDIVFNGHSFQMPEIQMPYYSSDSYVHGLYWDIYRNVDSGTGGGTVEINTTAHPNQVWIHGEVNASAGSPRYLVIKSAEDVTLSNTGELKNYEIRVNYEVGELSNGCTAYVAVVKTDFQMNGYSMSYNSFNLNGVIAYFPLPSGKAGWYKNTFSTTENKVKFLIGFARPYSGGGNDVKIFDIQLTRWEPVVELSPRGLFAFNSPSNYIKASTTGFELVGSSMEVMDLVVKGNLEIYGNTITYTTSNSIAATLSRDFTIGLDKMDGNVSLTLGNFTPAVSIYTDGTTIVLSNALSAPGYNKGNWDSAYTHSNIIGESTIHHVHDNKVKLNTINQNLSITSDVSFNSVNAKSILMNNVEIGTFYCEVFDATTNIDEGTPIDIPNGKTYIMNRNKLFVFVNGGLVAKGSDKDYIEFTTSQVKFNYAIAEKARIIFLIIGW